jgi:hypothetical protein
MEIDEESIRLISDLYHDRIEVNKAIELMIDRDISAELVKSIYNQLSKEAEKLTIERFHYYTIEIERGFFYRNVKYWTSRYLIAYDAISVDRGFHEIMIFDLFNDKLM